MWQISPDALMLGLSLLVVIGLGFQHIESWWCWLRSHFNRGADHESR